MRFPPAHALNDAIHRVLKRISVSPHFAVSACLHTVLLILVGGAVLNRVAPSPPDFQAGADGLLVEQLDVAQPPPASPFATTSDTALTPPPMMAPPLSALVTASQNAPTWKLAVIPQSPVLGPSSMKDKLASLGDRSGKLAARSEASAGAAAGSAGGARWAMIFGKRIVANRLGVILDVSASGHSRLGGAVEEIQKGFGDATIILYPGCGMAQFTGPSDCVIRQFSTITPQEISANTGSFTTRDQLEKALTIDSFKKMTAKPSVKNTLFVAWYGGPGKENSNDKMTGQTQLAFDDLITKRGVDTIYWFADFVDPVDPRVSARLSAVVQSRRVKVYIHSFAGRPPPDYVSELATQSGGTVNLEKMY